MNINFDFFDDPKYYEDATDADKVIISEFHKLLSSRFSVLKEQIEAEEILKKDVPEVKVCYMQEEKMTIKFKGYYKELTEKMKNSLSESDFDYLNRRLSELLGARDN